MIIDSTVEQIISELQLSYKKEFKKDISKEDIATIIDSQFAIIPQAMKDKKVVKLDKLGKFKIKEGRAKVLKSIKK